MKKITIIPHKNTRESGVALIYALALLGLLLVMLLGYLSSSILEQRIAYNQSSQVGANFLVKSALIRIKAQMSEYADASVWMLNRQKGVNSSAEAPFIAPLVSVENKEKSLGSNKTSSETDAYLALKPLLDKFGMANTFFPNKPLDYPEWINYSVSDGKSADRRITGRIAYAVIPGLGIEPTLFRNPNAGLILGKGQNELAGIFDFLTSSGMYKIYSKNNWLSLDLLTGHKGLLATSDSDYYASRSQGYIDLTKVIDEFYNPSKLERKGLVNYYFTPLQSTVKEWIWDGGTPITSARPSERYNLGTNITFTDALNLFQYTADGSQRSQIAANLVDYIDSDSIPTSDVDAATWATSTPPTYTGNERTPYINQIVPAVQGNYEYAVEIVPNSDGTTADVTETLTCSLAGKVWVELINPYDINLSGAVTVSGIKSPITISVQDTGDNHWTGSPRKAEYTGTISPNSAVTVPARGYAMTNGNIMFGVGASPIVFTKKTTNVPIPVSLPSLKLNMTVDSMDINRVLLQPSVGSSFYTDYAFSTKMDVTSLNLFQDVMLNAAVNNGKSETATVYANFEAYDARCNLNSDDWKLNSGRQACNLDGINLNFGSKNSVSEIKNTDLAKNQDLEPDDDPAKVSTAYIRNAPMRSLWELGLIHRGAKYQTINLKSALNPQDEHYDTERYGYKNDAQLLDRVTLHPTDVEKLKKFNINLPAQNVAAYAPLAGGHLKGGVWGGALYYDPSVRINFGNQNFPGYKTSNPYLSASEMRSLQEWMANKWTKNKSESYLRYIHRGMLANVIADWAMNGVSPYQSNDCRRDAQVEELIGKIVPLTRCGDIYEDFTVFAVAETVKDVGSTSGDKKVVKYDRNGNEHVKECKYGEIDTDGDFTFDEITGVSYLVARIRREIVECQNTKNCQNGIHEPGCKFKIRVLDSYVLNNL